MRRRDLGTTLLVPRTGGALGCSNDWNEGFTPLDADAPDEQLDEFRALIRSAFEQAQRSGKRDWEEMTSAVLKNRLLNITEGEFSQARYGSPSFINLVRRVDLLEVLDDYPPFRLRIISPVTTQADIAPPPEDETQIDTKDAFASLLQGDLRHVRIRDDLWRAIIDYSSGNTYVLDANTGLARPKTASDLTRRNSPPLLGNSSPCGGVNSSTHSTLR